MLQGLWVWTMGLGLQIWAGAKHLAFRLRHGELCKGRLEEVGCKHNSLRGEIYLPLVSREWKNGSNSSYNCTPFLHSVLAKGKSNALTLNP